MNDSNDPFVSIITCTYNSETYLPTALESVQNQSYRNVEHIINDSFSTDRTSEIIEDYITENRSRYPIKLLHTPPGGVARALNDATKEASGDILHYLHSDVYYIENDSLAKAASHFKLNPALVWLTGKLVVLFKGKQISLPNAEVLQLSPEKALSFTNFVSHENTFVRRELVTVLGGFNEDKNYNVEYSLWLKLIRQHRPLIVDTPFTVFIIHKGSTSTGSVLRLSKAFLRGFNTLKRERVFPLIGYYGDHFIYNQYERLVRGSQR
jgi:glycosyltransferase involved in cell wall biosynthesis